MRAAPVTEIHDYGPPVHAGASARQARRTGPLLVMAAGVFAAGLAVGLLVGPAREEPEVVAASATAGPTRFEDGIPVGFAWGTEGAVAAAEGFVRLFGTPWVLQGDRLVAAFETVADPSARAALASTARSVHQAVAAPLLAAAADPGAVVVRVVPVAAALVEGREGDSASVRVWTVTLTAVDGARPVESRWTTTRVDLAWADGDWKIRGVGREADSATPLLDGIPTQSTTMPAVLRDSEGPP